eukprot:gene16979-8482_t
MATEDQGLSSMIEPEEQDGFRSEECNISRLGLGQKMREVRNPSSASTVDLDEEESGEQDSEYESVIEKFDKKLEKTAMEESQHGLKNTYVTGICAARASNRASASRHVALMRMMMKIQSFDHLAPSPQRYKAEALWDINLTQVHLKMKSH